MGKSNQIVFPWYARSLPRRHFENVCVLGAVGRDAFTNSIMASRMEFHDITLDGWTIDEPWCNVQGQAHYDLIVCTRCAYFSSNPEAFVDRCRRLTSRNGIVFIDWGLGDHWRQVPYLVGWCDKEHSIAEHVEFRTVDGRNHISRLQSCFWTHALEQHGEARTFRNWIRMHGYDDDRALTEIVTSEVPCILDDTSHVPTSVHLLSLWPDAPQLYILTQYAGLQ